MIRMNGRINKTSAHHIMSSWLKHEAASDPIAMLYEIESPVTHRASFQFRLGSFYDANRITTGMGINTFKYSSHPEVKVLKPGRIHR